MAVGAAAAEGDDGASPGAGIRLWGVASGRGGGGQSGGQSLRLVRGAAGVRDASVCSVAWCGCGAGEEARLPEDG